MSHRHRSLRARTATLLLAVIGLAVATAASAGSAAATTAPRQSAAKRLSITVGSLTLPPCATSTLAWCTTVQVPFDYADPAAGTTGIYF